MKYGKIIGAFVMIVVAALTLYLVFFNDVSYVTFENNYGENYKLKITDGKVVEPNAPKKEGYRFVGWFVDDKPFDFDSKIDDNITLTAKFEKIEEKSYKVIFNTEGGSEVDEQNVVENDKAFKPADPQKEGFKFEGWYNNEKLYDFEDEIKADIKLTAKWKAIKTFEESEEDVVEPEIPSVVNPSKPKVEVSKPTVVVPEETKPEELKDTEKPTVNSLEVNTSSNKLIVSVVASDNKTESSNLKYEYSIDGVNYQSSNELKNLMHNKTYKVYVRVTDESNNFIINTKSIKTLKVTTPADGVLSETKMTNQNVTVTVSNSEVYKLQYSLDGITYYNAINNSVVLESNGIVYFRYTDMDGNFSDIYNVNISNIDKIVPIISSAECTPTVTTIACQVSATDSNNLTYNYSIDGINYSDSSKIKNLDDNKDYTVHIKVVDEAGNFATVTKNIKTLEMKDFDGEIEIHETMSKNPLIVAKNIDDVLQLQYSFDQVNFFDYTGDVETTYDNTNVYFRYKEEDCVSDNLVSEEIERKLSVLIVGNSFSGNTLYEIRNIAMYYGYEEENLDVGYLYKGGQSIDNHINDYNSKDNNYIYYNLNQKTGSLTKNESFTFENAILYNDWEYIVFQQNSSNSGLPDTYNNLNTLIDIVDNLKTNDYVKYGFNMTWAYQSENQSGAFISTYHGDQEYMFNGIINAVQDKVVTNDRIKFVIPVGTAIQNGRTSSMGDNFANLLSNGTPDTHITTDHGQTLLGLTFFGKLTGIDVSGFDYTVNIGNIPGYYYPLIAESAANAIENPYEVTNSEITYVPNLNEDGIDLNEREELEISGYTLHRTWNSTSTYPTQNVEDTWAYEDYMALSIITKEELPVGSIIILKPGMKVRFDGWVSETEKTPSNLRPGFVSSTSTTAKTIIVDEKWWSNFTIRGISLSKLNGDALTEESAAELFENIKIYVPKER